MAGRWVWVVGPDCYLDPSGREDPKLAPGAPAMRWACHRETRRGDLAVLYRSRRARDVAYLMRVVSDASHDPDAVARPWGCDAEVAARLPHPVTLPELRSDPVTATWPALRASFVRTGAPVPDDVWERLLDLASAHGLG